MPKDDTKKHEPVNVFYHGCKDEPVLKTITRIQSILEKNRISITETWFQNLDSFFSVRIVITGTKIGTNGKGITKEAALASALAELMERLQNQILILRDVIAPRTLTAEDFCFDPLEQILPPDRLLDLPPDFQKYPFPQDPMSISENWNRYRELIAGSDLKVALVPFYNVGQKTLTYLPFKFIQSIYGSNGMTAGNSPPEAIVQGISEILERYAAGQLYFNEITPPTIPADYLSRHASEQYRLIQRLEETGKLKVTVKDCSLGHGFPVVGVLTIFKREHRYKFNLGADPDFVIALERCLTECFQGIDMNRSDTLPFISSPLDLSSPISPEHRHPNFRRLMANYSGYFPAALFNDAPDYPFTAYPSGGFTSQRERLQFLLDLLQGLDYNIFIRDVSFLDFNSYYVIIPGLSENGYREQTFVTDRKGFDKTEFLRNLAFLPEPMLAALVADMEDYLSPQLNRLVPIWDYAGDMFFACFRQLTNPLLSFMTFIYYRLGDYEKAADKFNEYHDCLVALKQQGVSPEEVDFDFLYATKEFLKLACFYPGDTSKINRIMTLAFDEPVTTQVVEFFDLVRSDFGAALRLICEEIPRTRDCDGCCERSGCPYPVVENIYRTIKDKLKENPVDQLLLRQWFPDPVASTDSATGAGLGSAQRSH